MQAGISTEMRNGNQILNNYATNNQLCLINYRLTQAVSQLLR